MHPTRLILIAVAAALVSSPAGASGAGWTPPDGTTVYVGLARVGYDSIPAAQVRPPGPLQTDVSGFDVTPPTLGNPTVPASGAASQALAFSVPAPYDLWGPLPVTWDFGEGTTATGTSVAHGYATGGARTVSASQRDTTAPVISGVSLTHTTFAVGSKSTAIFGRTRRPPRGTTIRFTLDEVAKIGIDIRREAVGLRSGKRCVKPTATLRRRHARACTRLLRAAGLRRVGAPGRNRVPFSGRIQRKALPAARYRLTIGATDVFGNGTTHRPVRFRIVRAR